MSMSVATGQRQFTALMRLFHWLTAALVLTILGIGVAMVASLADYHRLVSIHRPLGILILIVVRFFWRLTHPVAPESQLPDWQRLGSELVHWLLYLAVLATTISGWFIETARGWTVNLYGALPLPRLVEEGSGFLST